MQLIIKDRGKGKTAQLIYASEITGMPIAQLTRAMCNHTKQMAKEMGCIIPEPVTVDELRNLHRVPNQSGVLVDNVHLIISDALNHYLNANVIGGTMTDLLKHEKILRGYVNE